MAAASLVTHIGDELILDQREFSKHTSWLSDSVKNKRGRKKEYKEHVNKIRKSIERLESLVPELKDALGELLRVADGTVTEDIETTIRKVEETGALVKKTRNRFDSLDKAVGLGK
ncbi:hypothetical protein ElyMa_003674400 [Elysia marginata]|uniref:Uncharacterized protein n=1 Tax=Elysia marginata TaxID=1093978 RepID=A0AAV4EZ84_9GAST|nr:hypothetical protein ElyMa_003674400 [Elysia marginata]